MKKIVALLLTAVMVLGCVPGLAETTKHERVYVVTTADGTIKSITDSVRLENADGLDEIMDQTILTDILNAGGKETFTLDGESLTWQANGKDIKAKAVMQIMSAGIKKGTEVELVVTGGDEQAVLDEFVKLFEDGFGE